MFKCNCCGECCKHMKELPQDLILELDSGDGVCKYLNRDLNLCSIYDKRPDICRHEWVYENIFKSSMSIEDYEQMLNELCSKYINLKEVRELQA